MYIFFPGVLFVHVCHYAWITSRTVSIHVQIVMLSSEFTNHKLIILLTANLTKRASCKRIKYFIPHNIITLFYTILII